MAAATRPPGGDARSWLLGALLLHVAAQAVLVARGFEATGIDEAYRTFRAWWWARDPAFTTSEYWLPVPTWLYGSVIAITGDLRTAPRVTAALLGLVPVVAAWSLAEGRARAWAALAAAGSPLLVMLATVPLSEPPFVAAATGGVALWEWGRRLRAGPAPDADRAALRAALAHAGAAVCFFAAAGCRYEGWIVAAVWAGWGIVRGYGTGLRRAVEVALALLPVAFPAIWMAYQWGVHDAPLHFRDMIDTDERAAAVTGADFLRGLVAWSGPALVLAAMGVGEAVRRAGRRVLAQPAFFALAAALLAFLGPALLGQIPSQFPPRLVLPVELLAAPWAAVGLLALWERRRWAAVAIGAALCVLPFGRPWNFPDGAEPRGRALGIALGALLAPGERAAIEWEDVVFETAFVTLNRPRDVSPDRRPRDVAGYWWCGVPGRPVPPPEWARPTLLALRAPGAAACVEGAGGYLPIGEAGGFTIWRVGR